MGNRTRAEPRRGGQGAGVATGRVCPRRRAAALRRAMAVDRGRGRRRCARLGLTPRVIWPRAHGSTRRGSRTRGRITASPARKAPRPPAFPFGFESPSSWAGMLHGRLFFVKNTAGAEACDRRTGNDSDTMTTPTDVGIEPPGESVKSGNCGLCRLDGARAPVAWLDKAWSRGAPSRRIAPAPRRAP